MPNKLSQFWKEAAITPGEIIRIESSPTSDLVTQDYYQRGSEEEKKWWTNRDTLALTRAEELFMKALERDPAYARTHAQMAWITFGKHNSLKDYMSEEWGDPLFDSIRNEPEFRQIIGDVETKYEAEHERIRQWL